MFKTTYKVRMSDTDMAQILYFANQFRFIHNSLEDFFEKIGLPFDVLFKTNPFVFVIVHAEANYNKTLNVGDVLTIELEVERLGTTSITFAFEIKRGDEIVGTARIVHVCQERESRTKMTIPDSFRKLLKRF